MKSITSLTIGNEMYNIWPLLLRIYCWTIIALTIISVTLGLLGKTLHIRKIAVRTLLILFEKISKNIEVHREEDDSDGVEAIGPGNNVVIQRDASKKIFRKMSEVPVRSKIFTLLDDSLDFVKAGVECIIEDEVTCRFSEEQLRVWNLLTRTSRGHQFQSWRLTTLWLIGFVFRYFVLFPIRLIIFFIGLFLLIGSTAVAGYIRDGKLRRLVNWHASLISYRVMSRALSIVATYHDCQNMAKPGGICVANHTSPMDVQVLSMDNCYALVGQKQGGLLGLIQRALNRASDHIWFERAEVNDRLAVKQRLKDHIDKGDAMSILIFPEGTCINNTSVMMFKKGSFEVEGATVHPVAIKYDARLGDAFWNSSKQSYFQYVLMLMTSWATVVDVWYLPAMHKEQNESGIEFALRVKHAIATAGGFVELNWDGQLKRYPVKHEELEKQRERWGRRVNRAVSSSMDNDSSSEY